MCFTVLQSDIRDAFDIFDAVPRGICWKLNGFKDKILFSYG